LRHTDVIVVDAVEVDGGWSDGPAAASSAIFTPAMLGCVAV
jgi:hypothetical protein